MSDNKKINKEIFTFQYSYLENVISKDETQILSDYIFKETQTETLMSSDGEHIYGVLWVDSCDAIDNDIQEAIDQESNNILNEEQLKRINYLRHIQKLLMDVMVKMRLNNIEFLFI